MPPAFIEARTVLVAYNEQGWRIGETHHRARISDCMVEQIRDMHEYDGKTPRQIAAELGFTFRTIKKICDYERRVQLPHSWRRVQAKDAAYPRGKQNDARRVSICA